MYGMMQEAGLTETIPPVFSHPEFPQDAREGGCSGWLLDGLGSWQPPFVSILSSLRAHRLGSCNVMAWWLQHPLFTEMAGNVLVLIYKALENAN